jgi:predicted alpha/beta-fold hydrolase
MTYVSLSESNYIRNIMSHLRKNGYRPICLNARGTGNNVLKTPVPFNCAKTNDCRTVIRHLHIKYPKAPILAIGYSLGANILTKYLSEEGKFVKMIIHAKIESEIKEFPH